MTTLFRISGISSAISGMAWTVGCFIHNFMPQRCIEKSRGVLPMRGSSPAADAHWEPRNLMRIQRLVAIASAVLVTTFLAPVPALAAPATGVASVAASCSRPESNAEALVILEDLLPGKYWWDHTALTVEIQEQPRASAEHLAAVRRAIVKWNAVLSACFDNVITLTEVSGRRSADIVVHFLPRAGGAAFGGVALCHKGACQNVIVSYEGPSGLGFQPGSPTDVFQLALHELGHALGLGHATNLEESNDLMGYGWLLTDTEPILSDCDVDALAYVWSWALTGTAPAPPGPGPYDCSGS